MLDLLERLDRIETLDPEQITDTEIVDVMEQVILKPGGLQILVERYSGSHIPLMVRSLSFLVSVAASSPTQETCPLIFSSIEQLHCQEDESTLINCLTAIQRQLIHGFSWKSLSKPPPCLYYFLIHCLEQSLFVQRGAIAVLWCIYEDNLMETFEPSDVSSLRDKLVQLSALPDTIIEMEMDGMQDFLK